MKKKHFLVILVAILAISIFIVHRTLPAYIPDGEYDTGFDNDVSDPDPPQEPVDEPDNGDKDENGGGSEPPLDYDPDNIDLAYLIEELKFLQNPIPGTVLCHDNYLPNAPRPYRNGYHEGLDFYSWARGGEVARGTPIGAAAPGIIIRIDHEYEDITPEDFQRYMDICREEGRTPEDILDLFRGRQVWIEHDRGIITRYCHLEDVASTLQVGDYVTAGTEIGTVGTSGTREPVRPHLHFEIRIGSYFLGQGMTVDQVREIYRTLLFD